MPTNDQISALYNFEAVMEMALAQLFIANDVKAFGTQWIPKASTGDAAADAATDAANIALGYSLLDFQLDRPRVEIMFTPGAGAGQFNNKVIAGTEMPVETSWSGQFKVDCITPEDSILHAQFRTLIRYILHTQLQSINGNQLTMHKVQQFAMDAGTTPVLKLEEGVFITTILFDINFSIQDDAWDTLKT